MSAAKDEAPAGVRAAPPAAALRSPLGRALGRGAAGDGVSHWWAQRLSSIALVPLTLWFVFALLGLPALDFSTVRSWISEGWTPVWMGLLVAIIAHHSWLGVQVVLEDYVHSKSIKLAALLASTFAHLLLAAAGVYAVLKLAILAA
jgi:succinate dehydrogenase / fumarate reductase membrane anchor subunit